ncbi:MAG: cadherin-like domain-containing protein, partial [Pseudomonadota bacterium]|nr:cadherin-like domain-containing protein [Pseudomonadota bacterium]
MALSQTQISQLYVAIFNRASEGEGNSYWQAFDSAPEVATAMLATPDAQQYFGSSIDTNQAFIETIYLNTLNKTPADDQAGIDYWVGQLDSGASRGQVVSDLVAAVESYADSTDPATARAYNQFTNRVEVSNYTADNLQEAPDDYATSLNFGAGLIVTDDDATVASAQTKVDVASGEFMLVADAASVNEGESVSFTLSNGTPNTEYAYKVEGNGAVGEVAAVTTDANGSATITVAASDVLGADAPFSVSIIGEGLSSEVTAVAVNDAPELTGDAAITGAGTEDAAVTVAASDLLAGYTDEEGDTLSVANVVADNGATVTDDGNGTYTIEPAADFNGEVTVSYDVTDGTDATAASWTVDFAAVNDAPTTSDATAAATEAGNAVEGQLVAEDVDGDDLSFTLDTAVEGLTLNADGSYSFDPSANTAVQALTYKDDPLDVVANYTVDDGNGGTAQGTLTIAVEPTPLTFTLEQSTAKVEEGSVVEYTIVASEPVQEDFAGEIQIALEAGDTAALEDFGSGSFNPQPVTIAAGETTSTVATITPKNDAATELPETFTATATVAGFVVEDIQTTVQDPSSVGGLGQTFTLTT